MRSGAMWVMGACSCVAMGQDRIETDRPDFTESTSSIAKGIWQIETGFTYGVGPGAFAFEGPEALLRYGGGSHWEVRIGLPSWTRLRIGGVATSGHGDASLGAKFALGDCGPWSRALIVETTVPVGSDGFGSDRWDPAVHFIVGRELRANWSLASMVSASTRRDSNSTVVDGGLTLVLGRDLGGGVQSFLEYAGAFPRGARSEHLLHTGLTFQPSPSRQWDIHFGVSLVADSPGALMGAGYSWKF